MNWKNKFLLVIYDPDFMIDLSSKVTGRISPFSITCDRDILSLTYPKCRALVQVVIIKITFYHMYDIVHPQIGGDTL